MPIIQGSRIDGVFLAFQLLGAQVNDETVAPSTAFLIDAFFSSAEILDGLPCLAIGQTTYNPGAMDILTLGAKTATSCLL
jgi:hypothetical protein